MRWSSRRGTANRCGDIDTKQVAWINLPSPTAERSHGTGANGRVKSFPVGSAYDRCRRCSGYSLFLYSRGESGPLALPGKYTVKLTAGGKDYTRRWRLIADPRVKVGMEDLKKQFDLLTRIHRDLANLYSTVNQSRTWGQLKGLQSRLPENRGERKRRWIWTKKYRPRKTC